MVISFHKIRLAEEDRLNIMSRLMHKCKLSRAISGNDTRVCKFRGTPLCRSSELGQGIFRTVELRSGISSQESLLLLGCFQVEVLSCSEAQFPRMLSKETGHNDI